MSENSPKRDRDEERAFIHDLATPLGCSMFLVDMIIDDLKAKPEPDAAEIKRSEELYQMLEKMNVLIKARRSAILAAEGANAGS